MPGGSSLHLVPRTGSLPKRFDSRRWRMTFQILTVVGIVLVLISLLLLLQGLSASDVPAASLRV